MSWFMTFSRQRLIYSLLEISYCQWPRTKQLNMFTSSLNYILTKDFFLLLLFRWSKMTLFPWVSNKNITRAAERSIGNVTQRSQLNKAPQIWYHKMALDDSVVTSLLLGSVLTSQYRGVVTVHPLSLNTSSRLNVMPNNWISNINAYFILVIANGLCSGCPSF